MKIFNHLQYLWPQKLFTHLSGWLAHCEIPFVKKGLIHLFLKRFNINLDEALDSNFDHYASFNHFFTRRLKPDVRTIVSGKDTIASPVDGTLYQFGKIDQHEKFNVKGFDFTLTELLGGDNNQVKLFREGDFCCLYLSPEDYHRVHMPITGTLQTMTYVPGRLFSVAPNVLETVPKVFSRNERMIALFETAFGPMIVILVGAIIVGSIHTIWAGSVNHGHSKKIFTHNYKDENITLEKGDELGFFEMGSTVITLFPKNKVQWLESMKTDTHKLFGELLGHAD